MRALSAGLTLSAAILAFASTASVTPAAAQTAQASSGGIEEVTVTAQRREEKLSKVPASVSAFPQEKMEQLDIKDFSDLVKYTPGVSFDTDTNNVSIRGVNSTAGDATTGIYIDDAPIQLRTLGFGSDNTLPQVFDLERVEVLRGPQGTLFGAGSEGGTVRYITPQPSLTDWSVYGKTEISDTRYGDASYEGGLAVGGPIVEDKLGFRISAWGRRDGGWIDKVDYMTGDTIQKNTNFVNTYVVRGALAWQVTNDLLITPSVFYQNRDVNNDDEYWVGISDPDRGVFKTGTPERMGDKDRFVLPALKVDWNFDGAELISNTSYFDRKQLVQDYSATLYDLSYFQQSVDNPDPPTDVGGLEPDFATPCPGGLCASYNGLGDNKPPLLTATGIDLPGFGHYEARNIITNKQENFTQEVRLQSTDPQARLSWIIGGFYSHEDQLSIEEINDPQLPALTQYLWGDTIANVWGEDLLANGDDYINHTQAHEWQLAGFANATYAITDTLKLQAGARIAATHFDFTNFSDGPQNFGFLQVPGGKKDETPFTPMGSLTWQFNPDDMVYTTVAKGYRIGGANPLFPVAACSEITTEPTSYNSDSVVSYEAGTKDRFFGGQLQASGSIYYLQWDNIQQAVTLPSCGFKYTVNQGAAESKGFDLEGEWLATDALDIDFSLGYTDAHYTSTSNSAGLDLAERGDRLPGSPWTFSVGAQYNANVWGKDSFFRVDYEFASRETGLSPERDPSTTLFDPALLPEPETNVVQVRAGTTLGNFNVSVFADNLFDARPQLDLNHQDSNTLLFEAETLRPRTIGLTGTYKY